MSEPDKIDEGFYLNAYNRLGLLGINNVADLGCGVGPFVRIMTWKNQKPGVYWGVDASLDNIETARRLYPGWRFSYGDFLTDKVKMEFVKFDAFLILKVLEYLDEDLGLLQSLPSGRPVVFSAPSFEAPGHRRWFSGEADLKERYSPILNLELMGRYVDPKGKAWFMNTARRW
ncbi:MAG: class I SAM-dependent methyltransferase [Thermodesulfobacteriota bacterium]